MRKGGGKAKGADFERAICEKFSLWVSGGKRKDLYWRSAMSGGRATVRRGDVRQAGDICAVAAEGHYLTDTFYFELKHYKKITLDCLLWDKGELITLWKQTLVQAAKYNRVPVLLFRKNGWPVVWCTTYEGMYALNKIIHPRVRTKVSSGSMFFLLLDDILKTTVTEQPRG
jgi:hypothetical protein